MTRAGAPIAPGEVLSHLVLPALALALAFGHHLAVAARLVEAAVAQTRTADYVLNARARGAVGAGSRCDHVVRTSLGPFLAQIGTSTGGLLGGAYAVEAIFSWPGMGRACLQAATGDDYPVLMAIMLLTGVAVVLGNLVADLAVAWLYPRVRLGGVLPLSLAPDRELAAGEAVLAS